MHSYRGVWVPDSVLGIEELLCDEKLVLMQIHQVDTGPGYPFTDETLARIFALTTERVQDILAKLEAAGYIDQHIDRRNDRWLRSRLSYDLIGA